MPGYVHHVSLFVEDLERSLELFEGILGLEVIKRLPGVKGERIAELLGMPGFAGDMVFLKHPGQKVFLELVRQTSPARENRSPGAGGGCGLSFMVDDLDALHTRLKESDWPPLSPPLKMPDPSGRSIRIFCLRSDEGFLVEFLEKPA